MIEILKTGLNELNLDILNIDRHIRFSEILIEQNKLMNLTAITQPNEIAIKHILDSVSLLKYYDLSGKSVIDIGCGAGFPSMPIKIQQPSVHMTFLDSLAKRIGFIENVSQTLELNDYEAIHARAEDVLTRECFDFALTRAVARLNILAEISLAYVKIGGKYLVLKSINCDDEITQAKRAIKLMGGEITNIIDYIVPCSDITHRIIEITKIHETPKIYPRSFAKIKKKPL